MRDLIVSADMVQLIVEHNLMDAENRDLIGAGYYLGMYDALMIVASQIAGGGLEGRAMLEMTSQLLVEAIHNGIIGAVASTGIHPGYRIGTN